MPLFLIFLLGITFFINQSLASSSNNSLNYPKHLENIIEKDYSTSLKRIINRFSLKFAEEVNDMNFEDCVQKRALISKNSKKVFYNLYHEQGQRIPHLTHRIWITSNQNPFEASQERIDFYLESLKKFSTGNWKHHFWCMQKSKIPETIKSLMASEIPIEIHELSEIFPEMKGKHIFDALYLNNQFCLASNIARQNIVYLYGGVYSDFGTLIIEDLTPFVDAYDYIFWFNGGFIDQCFFGYKKEDLISKKFLQNLDNLSLLPKKLTPSPTSQLEWGSGGHFMGLFDVFSSQNDRFLFIPEGEKSLFKINHARSWLHSGKFGNIPLSQSNLDIFDIPNYQKDFTHPYEIKERGHDTALSLKIGKLLYGIDKNLRIEKRKEITNKSKSILFNLLNEQAERIPHITHRIWITGEENPYEVNQQRLSNYLRSLRNLKGNDWKHYFWCMETSKIPNTIKFLKSSSIPIEIHELNEIFPQMKGKHVIDVYIKDKQFCFASDVARFNIINLYGGLYSDIGTLIHSDLTIYFDAYDFLFRHVIKKDESFPDVSFFAAKKNNNVFNMLLQTLDTLYEIPEELQKNLTPTPRHQQAWHTSPHLMACIDAFSNEEERLLFMREKSIFSTDHAGSWYGKENLGNKKVSDSQLNIFSAKPLPKE